MSSLVNASIDVTKIPKDKLYQGKKGNYLSVTVSVNDETDQYGNNASIYVAQSKEEREAKADRIYLGNGKVVWNDGNITNAVRDDESLPQTGGAPDDADSLPF